LLLGIVLLPMSCNSPFVKNRLSQIVLESRQRTLKIDGDLLLSFSLAPAIGIRLGHVELSEHNSSQIFAAFDGAQATLQLVPLLSRQIVVERIELTGLKATLVRRQDGTLNIDDLLLPKKPDTAMPQFAIAGLRIADGELGWRDESNGMTLTLGGIQLDNGRLANAAKDALQLSARLHTPQVDDIGIKLKVRYDYDLQAPRFSFGELDAQFVSPQVGGLSDVDIRVALNEPVDLGGAAQALKIGKLAMQFAATAGTVRLAGKFDTPLVTYLPAQTLELEKFTGEFSIAGAQLSLPPLTFSGNLRGDFTHQSVAGNLAGQFADSHIVAKFDVMKFSPLALTFDLDIDRLDADRYLPASDSRRRGSAFDPAILDRLDLRGTLRIGTLHVVGATARKVRFDIRKKASGKLDIVSQGVPRSAKGNP
jgi:AsmA protein